MEATHLTLGLFTESQGKATLGTRSYFSQVLLLVICNCRETSAKVFITLAEKHINRGEKSVTFEEVWGGYLYFIYISFPQRRTTCTPHCLAIYIFSLSVTNLACNPVYRRCDFNNLLRNLHCANCPYGKNVLLCHTVGRGNIKFKKKTWKKERQLLLGCARYCDFLIINKCSQGFVYLNSILYSQLGL